jgi:hypothetical protein
MLYTLTGKEEMTLQQFKEKLYTGVMATIVSTLTTYLMFNKDINYKIIWIVFLVYGLAIFTYGIGVSTLANFISNKFKKRTPASLVRLLIYIIFGGTYFLFEFIGVYGLIAALNFFIFEEIIRAIISLKEKNSSSANGSV